MQDELRDKRKRDFFIESNAIFEQGLSRYALLVRLYLARCADSNEQSFPSLKTIATKCDMGRSTVAKALNELEEKGLVAREQRKKPDSDELTTTLYTLLDCSGSPQHGLGVVHHRDGVVHSVDGEQDLLNKTQGKGRAKKIQLAEFVAMTEAEYGKLIEQYGDEFTAKCIEVLDNHKGAKGTKYASDYRAILKWVIESVMEKQQKQQHGQPSSPAVNSVEKTREVLDQAKRGMDDESLRRIGGTSDDWLNS